MEEGARCGLGWLGVGCCTGGSSVSLSQTWLDPKPSAVNGGKEKVKVLLSSAGFGSGCFAG